MSVIRQVQWTHVNKPLAAATTATTTTVVVVFVVVVYSSDMFHLIQCRYIHADIGTAPNRAYKSH